LLPSCGGVVAGGRRRCGHRRAVRRHRHPHREARQRRLEPQHADGLPDGRPQAAVGVRAPEPDGQHALHLRDVELAVQPRVGGVEDAAPGGAAVRVPDPLRQVDRVLAAVDDHRGPPAAGHLEKDDAEAVHVGLDARPPGEEEALRVDVPHRAGDARRARAPAVVYEPREAEVAEPGAERRVQHDVARLDVAVHDALLRLVVQVHQRGADAEHDLVPGRPWQHVPRTVDVGVEAAIGHELVDEEQLVAAVVAPADERHEVAVAEPADDPHLGDELLPSLTRCLGHPLHGHVAAVQEPAVHRPEAATPQPPVVGEVRRGRGELAVVESPGPGGL
ncbi:Os12g0609025, partial [Oryza sativa Japonica Group]